ncbi:MAG: carbohydrate-binding family 9-like protein [Pyrinomonadaceae bacterium]|jgi:alpha-galactosidase|nr:carbohydrate-binding family 9-like protein [Acidobacteriota bacterium]
MIEMSSDRIVVKQIIDDFRIESLDNPLWHGADCVHIEKYWSGEPAPPERYAEATLLWSETAFYVRFAAEQSEPLIISENPDLESKTFGLWDRDVCEIFISPDAKPPGNYFEFEIAPTGEWVDIAFFTDMAGNRKMDTNYASGMQTAARIEQNKIVVAMKVEWKAFGKKPEFGDVWRGNLFRCVGKNPDRGYLAWRSTRTETPNFHVPEAFGELEFSESMCDGFFPRFDL